MSRFHFSPRPNRAHEIPWKDWDAQAFDAAQRESKPILLSISAVWCHWCHVMDETTYSDPSIIEAIGSDFVAVRVDNDRRPDVNARYNQGGWPTTAFLTPQGDLLAGATYLPPEQMRSALQEIAAFYRSERTRIEDRARQLRDGSRARPQSAAGALNEEAIAELRRILADAYDAQYGGFGTSQKFPMLDALEFLLQEFFVTEDQELYQMVARTMLSMSSGGMYDHVEGGFFRYSTTRDWSVPHFEKMTEDHAGHVRLLSGLLRSGNPEFRETLLSTLRYIRDVLYDPQSHFFAGSQDADEAYYALPLEERRPRQAPYVDRTSYTNWTAALAGALTVAGSALDDDAIVAQGCATLDALHERMRDPAGLLHHFIEPGASPAIRGLLTDQSAYFRALLDAHEHAGQDRFLRRATEIAAAIERDFAAPEGGFYDRTPSAEQLGALRVRDRPLVENASVAESLLRLGDLCAEDRYMSAAQRTLALFTESYRLGAIFAAPLGKALRRLLRPAVRVALVGTSEETAELREAAYALPEPYVSVRTIAPLDTEELLRRGFDNRPAPCAYVCSATACAAPATGAPGIRASYDQLLSTPGG